MLASSCPLARRLKPLLLLRPRPAGPGSAPAVRAPVGRRLPAAPVVVAVLVAHSAFRALDPGLFVGRVVVDPVGLLREG